MMGPSHRVVGACAWIVAAPALHVPLDWRYAAGVTIAAAFAHGRLSPDADRYPLLARIIPGGHRGITHWWPVVLALFVAAAMIPAGLRWVATWAHQSWLAVDCGWVVLAVAVAWASHQAADAAFGRIPIWPRLVKHRRQSRWRYAGLSLDTDGKIEHRIAVPAVVGFTIWFVTGAWWLALAVAVGWAIVGKQLAKALSGRRLSRLLLRAFA